MSQLLLDTTFLIDAERGEEALDQLIDDDDDVAISAVTVAELMVGVRLATARHRARRQAYLDAVLVAIPVTEYDVMSRSCMRSFLPQSERPVGHAMRTTSSSRPRRSLRTARLSPLTSPRSKVSRASPSLRIAELVRLGGTHVLFDESQVTRHRIRCRAHGTDRASNVDFGVKTTRRRSGVGRGVTPPP